MPATALMTNTGKTALAALFKNYYLVIEGNGSTVANAGTVSAGATSIETAAGVDLAGDTAIVLGAGLASQEVVTFSAVSGAGPYTYTISATTQNHSNGDPVCRLPLTTDTMAQVVNELQYDSTNDPGQRLQSVSGYSTGVGEWTLQFYLTGIEASNFLMTVGIADSPTISAGNLLYHAVLGVNHVYNPVSGGVDIEIDIPIQLS